MYYVSVVHSSFLPFLPSLKVGVACDFFLCLGILGHLFPFLRSFLLLPIGFSSSRRALFGQMCRWLFSHSYHLSPLHSLLIYKSMVPHQIPLQLFWQHHRKTYRYLSMMVISTQILFLYQLSLKTRQPHSHWNVSLTFHFISSLHMLILSFIHLHYARHQIVVRFRIC